MGLALGWFGILLGCQQTPRAPDVLNASYGSDAPTWRAPSRQTFVPGHFLVELSRGVRLTGPQAASMLGQPETVFLAGQPFVLVRQIAPEPPLGSPIERDDPGAGAIVLRARDDVDHAGTEALLRALAQDASVRRAEPDRFRHAMFTPNDPLWLSEWSLPLIRVPQAWKISQSSPQVVVAVLDTGILPKHPDLVGQLVPGFDFVSRHASAEDGDFYRDADPTDTGTVETSRLHGTHVAGIIGAATDNALGIAGVAPKCRLMPVRVLGNKGGDGIDSDIADALRWLTGAQLGTLPKVSTRVDVANLSFGGPGLSFSLQRAVDETLAAHILVVVASGNGGVEAREFSPGGLDGVLTVGASDRAGRRAVYSNWGSRVDVLAPGGGPSDFEGPQDLSQTQPEGILSTYRDVGTVEARSPPYSYEALVGTSQAAPHAAGVAALLRAMLPNLSQPVFVALGRASANPMHSCHRDELDGCGAGLLDAEKAVHLAQTQKSCGCPGDLWCENGVCQAPPKPHDSVWTNPVVSAGSCSLSSARPSRTWAAPLWLVVVVLGCGFAVKTARRK